VKYQLPFVSKVSLKVYNILGQEINTIVDEIQSAGFKQVEWNSTNNYGITVGSGVYFYRIDAASVSDPGKTFTQVKKMLLVR
jgi:flagellar hook assembly protein FlgD